MTTQTPVLKNASWLTALRNSDNLHVCNDWEGFEWIETAPDSDEFKLTGERLDSDEVSDLIND